MYGNCQAGVFADCFKGFQTPTVQWDMHYVMNFVHPSEPQQRIADEALARCIKQGSKACTATESENITMTRLLQLLADRPNNE